jgi:hypothetical protein
MLQFKRFLLFLQRPNIYRLRLSQLTLVFIENAQIINYIKCRCMLRSKRFLVFLQRPNKCRYIFRFKRLFVFLQRPNVHRLRLSQFILVLVKIA